MTEAKKQSLPTASNNTAAAMASAKKVQFSALIKSDAVQKSLAGTLGDSMRTKTFTSSLISAVSTNPALRECDGMSIISSALLGEALNLSPSPQLGHYYMVPFKDNKSGTSKATFQLGWKGYYQLAMRSGQYKSLDVQPIKEGELIRYSTITGEIELDEIADPEERESAKTIGYYAHFELLNGYQKSMYWSKAKMEKHALKYSKGYAAKKGYTFWEKDFDAMAIKTMYKQLIGKYGVMSTEMQTAYSNDMTVGDSIPSADGETSERVYFDAETGEEIE